MTTLAALWGRFYGWVIGAVGLLAAIAAVYFKGRSTGKKIEQQKATQRDVDEAKEHAEVIRETANIDAEVSRLPASDLDDRLRKWTRD